MEIKFAALEAMLVPEIMKCVHEFFPNYPDFDGIYELVVIFFF